MATTDTQQQETGMQAPEPQKEHKWLQQLVGEWTYEAEWSMAPGEPTQTSTGRETVRSLGGLWIVGEGHADESDEESVLTLGFDPNKGRFVGTWVGGMMTYLWVYDGQLSGDTLTLDCVGPAFDDPNKTANYQDIIDLKSDRERIHISRVQGEDGSWTEFMRSTYRRK